MTRSHQIARHWGAQSTGVKSDGFTRLPLIHTVRIALGRNMVESFEVHMYTSAPKSHTRAYCRCFNGGRQGESRRTCTNEFQFMPDTVLTLHTCSVVPLICDAPRVFGPKQTDA
ncbi:unnamed protein product [Periconia digitata]|uniref:Uncharacterized protein n=1 Tax=Periconia digitata TaxID=1303443 RepID=A0A9W4XHX9_9PLEO|nr:unnamed protein product [Periconia digitata]